MVESNMLTTYIDNGRYYKISYQLEYIEPEIIERRIFASKFEAIVAQYFEDKKIYFVSQKTFKDCKNIRCLPFDFCININNTDILIEYNSVQHYKPVDFFGGIESFKKQIYNDNIKEQYTIENNIPFIKIDSEKNSKNKIYKYLDNEIAKIIK
jgi:hypothetical protein